MRSLFDIVELSTAELDALIATANDMMANPAKYAHVADGKKLATLFFDVLHAVVRSLFETVEYVAYHFPVHKVLGVHDRGTWHQVHGGAYEIIVIADADEVGIRAVAPEDGVGECAVTVVAGLLGSESHCVAACCCQREHWNEC